MNGPRVPATGGEPDDQTGLIPAPLPGGVGVSHISAYDWPAADGVCGGRPHVHLACTEAYVVIEGRGACRP